MILEILILVLAVPTGYLIAWLTREELAVGRKYFRVLIILSILGVMGFWIYGFSVSALTSGFILIISLISFIKSYDKKWAKRKL